MRVLVPGGTGFVGKRLVDSMRQAGHEVLVTSRSANAPPPVGQLTWDTRSPLPDVGRLDAIVNLVGERIIGKRWTARQKAILRDSRVHATTQIARWVASQPASTRPVLVNASAVGIYGARPQGPCPESRGAGEDFAARLCHDWEVAAVAAPTRVVCLRLGHILAPEGGYLGELLPFAKLGLAGPIAGGRQPAPWVGIGDVVAAIDWAVASREASGAYNVVAPASVGCTQADLARTVSRHLHRPVQLPVPGLALALRFGSEPASVLTGGQDVRPERLAAAGFAFDGLDLATTLQRLV